MDLPAHLPHRKQQTGNVGLSTQHHMPAVCLLAKKRADRESGKHPPDCRWVLYKLTALRAGEPYIAYGLTPFFRRPRGSSIPAF